MKTPNGNYYYISGIFAFTLDKPERLTHWEDEEELFSWVDSQCGEEEEEEEEEEET